MTERPLECSQCKKKACISYQEIANHSTIYTQMCAECPVLKEKLGETVDTTHIAVGDMCCVRCHTSLEQILETSQMGCSNCYAIFCNLVESFAHRLGLTKPFYRGRIPLTKRHFSATEQITNLTQALSQALKSENYEDAASLRDEIQALMSEDEICE